LILPQGAELRDASCFRLAGHEALALLPHCSRSQCLIQIGHHSCTRATQGAELHDASYFRLAGHEALALDPQTRLLLEATAEVVFSCKQLRS